MNAKFKRSRLIKSIEITPFGENKVKVGAEAKTSVKIMSDTDENISDIAKSELQVQVVAMSNQSGFLDMSKTSVENDGLLHVVATGDAKGKSVTIALQPMSTGNDKVQATTTFVVVDAPHVSEIALTGPTPLVTVGDSLEGTGHGDIALKNAVAILTAKDQFNDSMKLTRKIYDESFAFEGIASEGQKGANVIPLKKLDDGTYAVASNNDDEVVAVLITSTEENVSDKGGEREITFKSKADPKTFDSKVLTYKIRQERKAGKMTPANTTVVAVNGESATNEITIRDQHDEIDWAGAKNVVVLVVDVEQ